MIIIRLERASCRAPLISDIDTSAHGHGGAIRSDQDKPPLFHVILNLLMKGSPLSSLSTV